MKEQDKDIRIFKGVIGIIGSLSFFSLLITLISLVWIQNVFMFKLILTEVLVFIFCICISDIITQDKDE